MHWNDPVPSTPRLSRRALLRRSGSASLALGTAAVSGCVERLSALGLDGPEELDVPPAESPRYGAWIPAPSALADDLDLDPNHLMHATPGEAHQLGGLFTFPHRLLPSMLDWFGRGYAHYDRALMVDEAIVLEGTIDRSVVEDAFADTAYETAGIYEGYDLYGRSDVRRTVAIGADAIVFSKDEHSERNVKAVIDAADGRIDRYQESDEGFGRLLESSGSRPTNWFTPGDGDFVQAISATYDADYVYHVYHRLYSDPSSIAEADLEAEFRRNGNRLNRRATTVDTDGRLATVVQQYDRGTYPDASTDYEWPQITWGIDHHEDAEEVTIHHEAGESVDAELLAVEYGPDEPADAQFADEYDTVEPGDDLVLDLSTRRDVSQVLVVYSPGEHASALLFDYRLD